MLIFKKYQGTGNDFIIINNLAGTIALTQEEVAGLCDRNFGIGADGLILVEKSNKDNVDCFMNYSNSDGTTAEMCGNGVRCTAKFFAKESMESKVLSYSLRVDTRAGIKDIEINTDGTVSVDMGAPIFESIDFPSQVEQTHTEIEGFKFDFVSMGNPHAVTFVKNLNNLDINNIGPKIENNALFPNKINVEFAEKLSDDYYKVRVWERVCGETLSCGTGACAVFVVLDKFSERKGLAEKEITLEFPGGKLFLSKNEQGHVILRGPATFVFEGQIGN
jgi:diaminopimelate epimerase